MRALSATFELARDAILAHRDRIASGELTWVPRSPEGGRGECCVGYVATPERQRVIEPLAKGHVEVNLAVEDALDAEAGSRGQIGFPAWNDHVCTTAQQACEFLTAAADRLDPEWAAL